MKVIIVGGVAGGASCAARLHRLDEKAEILMVERGPYVSYANCGLPYHIGGVIEKEPSLLVARKRLARLDRKWLARLITRYEKPENFKQALERQPDDIKVVIQFSEM